MAAGMQAGLTSDQQPPHPLPFRLPLAPAQEAPPQGLHREGALH